MHLYFCTLRADYVDDKILNVVPIIRVLCFAKCGSMRLRCHTNVLSLENDIKQQSHSIVGDPNK